MHQDPDIKNYDKNYDKNYNIKIDVMPSIHDRDLPRPVLVKGDSSIDLIIIIVTILLIIIFWLALTYASLYDVVRGK